MPDDTVTVPLTQGREAIIDARFAAEVLALKWGATKGYKGNYYARHSSHVPGTISTSRKIILHRFVYELAYGPIPGSMEIDHINGNGLDNRIANLRVVTKRQNAQNRREHRNGHLYGTAYEKRRKKWQAAALIKGKRTFLGYFETEEAAHMAYRQALQQDEQKEESN